FHGRNRRRADQRGCAGSKQESAWRQEVLASSPAGKFPAEVLRANRRDEVERYSQRSGGISGGFSSDGTGGEESGLRGDVKRDQRKGSAGDRRCLRGEDHAGKDAGGFTPHN